MLTVVEFQLTISQVDFSFTDQNKFPFEIYCSNFEWGIAGARIMDTNGFETGLDDVSMEVWRLRSLIDACLHLFPDAPSQLKHQDELLAVLGAAQELVHRLEARLVS